jgi:hypothetical protein
MKKQIILLIVLFGGIVFVSADVKAQDTTRTKNPETQQVQNFVDEDGDGYNDNAPDHDGDGIPNGLDPDWKKQKRMRQRLYVDMDGDGINDALQEGAGEHKQEMHQRMGNQDGQSLNNTSGQEEGKGKRKRKGKSK